MARRDEDDDDDRDRDDEENEEQEEAPRKRKKGLSKEEKQMAMFCHIGTIIGGFLVPLIIWMIKKDESRFIDRHGKEALNFSITLAIVAIVGLICTFGILTLVASIMGIVFSIQAGMAASRGEDYQYSWNFRFIK